ncbi:DUF4145 domain-containing protein [Serratia fonticola]|uniref:DUF4145 domain-containing protein n=1 Tax=Serratia fonticola TaxID=47917 RepID=UPI001377F1E6|nr:DUF4145 domain-containing protein [Serratia fonticola]NBJ35191.1 DUF4145 domain-containing protein [Serratia fonticola]
MTIHKISKEFYQGFNIEWPCPACGQKTLQIIKTSFVCMNTMASRSAIGEDWFEPEMDSSVFSCMAECSRQPCREVVACIGDSGWEMQSDDEYGEQLVQWYQPKNFVPTLFPFVIPDKCPDEISKPLNASFSVYLSQPGSAANLIRITVERLLTAIGIPEVNGNGKRIVLHKRLESLTGVYASYKETLMAIKFLGNAGSHTYDEVQVNDTEDAFEIMSYVVTDLFSGRKESVDILAKRLKDKFDK